MTATQWVGLILLIGVLAVAGLAFRQGMKVKPENREWERRSAARWGTRHWRLGN
jgi:hypothetical protein